MSSDQRRASRPSRLRRPSRAVTEQAPSLRFTPKQNEFFAAVTSGRYRYLAMGGAIRGTKTWGLIGAFVLLMRLFPRSRWAIVRKDGPTLRRNTIPSIEKVRQTLGAGVDCWLGKLNGSTWVYRARNGSELLLFAEGYAHDPDLDRWKGLEVNGFGLEEANELQDKSFYKSMERAGSWIIPPSADERARGLEKAELQPPPLVLLTFNPADNWVRSTFYDPFEEGTLAAPYYYLPATIFDNPFVSQDYLDSLKNLPPAEYERFVLGKWGAIRDPMQLIPTSAVLAALEVPHEPGPASEGLDVARDPDGDETVFARFDGNALVELEAHRGWRIDETTTRAAQRLAAHKIDADRYWIDTVGLGAGVADNLRRLGWRVREFVAGAAMVDRRIQTPPRERRRLVAARESVAVDAGADSAYRFPNLRSQAWWEFAEKLRLGKVKIALDPTSAEFKALLKDLTAPRYEPHGDRVIKVESKDTIRERIGRSTDYGDAVVMAAFDPPPARRAPLVAPSTSRRTY